VHYDATFRTWRIVGERPAKTPRSFLLAQANKGGTPVRVDRGTGQWDIPEVAYKRFKLQAAASGSLGAGGGASSGTNALISRSVDVARVMETLSRSTATAYAQLPRNVLGLAQRQDFTVLYRVDSRPPWEIARHGFGSSDASDGYDIPAMLLSEDGGLPLVASETADGAYALSQRQRDAQPGSSWYLYAFNAEGRNAVSLRENYDHEVSRRVLEGMVPQGHRRLFADVSFNDARESQETHVEPDIPINRIRLLDTNAAATRQALSQALEQAADNVPYGAPVTAFADVGPAEPAVHMETDGGAQVESGIEGGEPQPPASTPIGNSRRVALSLQHDFEAAADAVPDASLQRNRLGFFERTDLGMAYRIDTRPPADIARDGFRSADRFDYMPPMLDPIGGQSPLIASATLGGAYEVIKWRHRDSTWYLYAFSAKGLHAVSLLDHLYRSERALARVFNDDVLVKNRKRPYENARRFAVMHIGTKVQAERVHLLDTNDPAMRARLSQALANRDSPETTCGISLSEVTGSEAAGPSEENLALARGTVNSAHLIARTDFATLYRVDARNPEDIADTGLGQSTDFGGTQGYSMLGGPALIASETRDGADAVRRSQFEDGAGAMQGSDNEDSPDAMQWSDDEGGLRSSHSPGHWYLYSIDAQGLRAASLLDNQRNAPQALSALLGENVAGRPPLELANGAGAFAETHVEPVTDARRVRLVDTNDPAFSNRLKEARQRYPDYVAGVPVTAFRMGGLAR
jgi:hypothetical protein